MPRLPLVTEWDSPPVGFGGSDLRLRCRRIGDDVVVVSVAGELDLATVPQLRAYLMHSTASRPAHLVVDLSAVTFLAARGIGVLMDVRDGRNGVHGQLHLTGVTTNPPVRHVLQMLG